MVAWRWKSTTSETWSHGGMIHMPPLTPAVHTSKEQQMHGAHHHRTAAERRAWSGKRVIFNFLLLNCLLFNFFVQRAPSKNLIFFITPFVLFVSLANYSLTLSQFYLIVRCAVWGHTKDHACLAFFYLFTYGFILHHELWCYDASSGGSGSSLIISGGYTDDASCLILSGVNCTSHTTTIQVGAC